MYFGRSSVLFPGPIPVIDNSEPRVDTRFSPEERRKLERIVARSNLISTQSENDYPPSLTEDQITTPSVNHLEVILRPEDFRDLERQMQDTERRRSAEGRRTLNRRHIHGMALRRDREIVVLQIRLRAAGIVSAPKPPIQNRLTNKFVNRLANKNDVNNLNKGRHDGRKRRTCNN